MPIYMKFDGIDGESTAVGHEKEIEILSFSWGATNQPAHAGGGGRGAGKVSLQDFHFVHQVDKASPKLMLLACQGRQIPSAVVSFTDASTPPVGDVKAGNAKAGSDRKQDYLVIKLKDILISSVRPGANIETDDSAMEAVSLNFSKVEMQYTAPDGEVMGGAS